MKILDIKWLFETKMQISKLQLKDNDILVIKPPENSKWEPKKAEGIHKIIKELLEKAGYKNLQITFIEDVDLGIINKVE